MNESPPLSDRPEHVLDRVERSESRDEWYDQLPDGVSFVEPDSEKWWSGTVYDVRFAFPDTGYAHGVPARRSPSISVKANPCRLDRHPHGQDGSVGSATSSQSPGRTRRSERKLPRPYRSRSKS